MNAIDQIIRMEANGRYADALDRLREYRSDPATPIEIVIVTAHYERYLASRVPVVVNWRIGRRSRTVTK